MSKSANKTLIGAFTVGAVCLVLLAVAVFGSGMLFKKTAQFVLLFDKSISGLSVGSPVVFQGVPVGRVVAIHLNGNLKKMSFQVPVIVELDLDDNTSLGEGHGLSRRDYLARLIEHGLRASLATQSLLTGQLMVELSFVPDRERAFAIESIPEYEDYPQIPTVPSKLDSIWHKLTNLPIEEFSDNLLAIVEGLNKAINSNHFSNMLVSMDELLTQLRALSEEVDITLDSIRDLATDYSKLARDVDPKLTLALDEATRALGSVSSAAVQARKTLSAADNIVDRNSLTVIELNKALREITEAARAVRVLAGTLERNPEAILRGKGGKR